MSAASLGSERSINATRNTVQVAESKALSRSRALVPYEGFSSFISQVRSSGIGTGTGSLGDANERAEYARLSSYDLRYHLHRDIGVIGYDLSGWLGPWVDPEVRRQRELDREQRGEAKSAMTLLRQRYINTWHMRLSTVSNWRVDNNTIVFVGASIEGGEKSMSPIRSTVGYVHQPQVQHVFVGFERQLDPELTVDGTIYLFGRCPRATLRATRKLSERMSASIGMDAVPRGYDPALYAEVTRELSPSTTAQLTCRMSNARPAASFAIEHRFSSPGLALMNSILMRGRMMVDHATVQQVEEQYAANQQRAAPAGSYNPDEESDAKAERPVRFLYATERTDTEEYKVRAVEAAVNPAFDDNTGVSPSAHQVGHIAHPDGEYAGEVDSSLTAHAHENHSSKLYARIDAGGIADPTVPDTALSAGVVQELTGGVCSYQEISMSASTAAGEIGFMRRMSKRTAFGFGLSFDFDMGVSLVFRYHGPFSRFVFPIRVAKRITARSFGLALSTYSGMVAMFRMILQPIQRRMILSARHERIERLSQELHQAGRLSISNQRLMLRRAKAALKHEHKSNGLVIVAAYYGPGVEELMGMASVFKWQKRWGISATHELGERAAASIEANNQMGPRDLPDLSVSSDSSAGDDATAAMERMYTRMRAMRSVLDPSAPVDAPFLRHPPVDLRVPLLFFTSNSSLRLAPNSRAGMLGSYNPVGDASGSNNMLYIRYMFRGHMMEVLLNECDAAELPMTMAEAA
jgi:DnaJ-like protein C11, C-terminal